MCDLVVIATKARDVYPCRLAGTRPLSGPAYAGSTVRRNRRRGSDVAARGDSEQDARCELGRAPTLHQIDRGVQVDPTFAASTAAASRSYPDLQSTSNRHTSTSAGSSTRRYSNWAAVIPCPPSHEGRPPLETLVHHDTRVDVRVATLFPAGRDALALRLETTSSAPSAWGLVVEPRYAVLSTAPTRSGLVLSVSEVMPPGRRRRLRVGSGRRGP